MQYVCGGWGGGGVPFEGRLGFDKIFNDNLIGMTDIRSSLTNIVEKFIDTDKYKLTVPNTQPFYRDYRAYIELFTMTDNQKLSNGLREEKINHHTLIVKPQFYSTVFSLQWFSMSSKKLTQLYKC